jgi:hypothetical protein
VLLNENNVNRQTANIVYKEVLAGIVSKFGLLRRTATDINTIIDLDLDLYLEIEM